MAYSDARERVIAEARSWCGTPFHHEGRLKGAGVDCGQLLFCVYEAAGITGHLETDHYAPDFHLHRDTEWYLGLVAQHAREVEAPQPGDIALFKFGRLFSHGGIVTAWPRLIHAFFSAGIVLEGDASLYPLAGREVRFFDPFDD